MKMSCKVMEKSWKSFEILSVKMSGNQGHNPATLTANSLLQLGVKSKNVVHMKTLLLV